MRVVEIENDLFNSRGYVFFECTPTEVAKYARKKLKGCPRTVVEELEGLEGKTGEGFTIPSGGNFIIWLKTAPTEPFSIAVLSHESSHAAFRLMKYWSIEVCAETNELLAMLVGFIVEKTLIKIAVDKTKKSKKR